MTQDELKELLKYDPETGVFTWRVDRANGRYKAGSIVKGEVNKKTSYRRLWINGKRYQSSHIANLYMTGEWPKEEMDHINRDPLDDRWCNLREATSSENKVNRILPRKDKHLPPGVYNKGGKYEVIRRINGEKTYLGTYETIKEAAMAYNEGLEYGNQD